MKTLYKKVFREVKIYMSRTLLALLGILFGIYSIGFVLSAYSILTREIDRNFMNTNPSSIVVQVSNLDENGVDIVKKLCPNTDIETRAKIQARINKDNGTYGTIYLYAVEDFMNIRVDKFKLENGLLPQGINEMALERDSLKNLPNVKNGYNETVSIMLPGGEEHEVYLSGKVHAPGLSPASMEKYSYGFLTLNSLHQLGYSGWYDEIHIVSYDNRFDREELRTMATDIKKELAICGYEVEQVDVPVPGRHPHGDQLRSFIFMLQAFTVIAFFSACIIIINLLNSIMSTQSKQIAIMKATGAKTKDITIPYFLYVFLISIVASIISIPMAKLSGNEYSNFAANTLNFNIQDYSNPAWIYIIQIVTGICIPLAASYYPIHKYCKITVREGLAGQVDKTKGNKERKPVFSGLVRIVNTKIKIPVNNISRKSGRTIFAIMALAAGGLIFMTAQNIVASIEKTVDASMDTFHYSYDIALSGQYSFDGLQTATSMIGNIDKFEVYKSNSVLFKQPDGLETIRYIIKALPRNSKMINLQILEGSDFQNQENAIVITQGLHDNETWLQLGNTTTIIVGDKSANVLIAGIVNEVPPLPVIYINLDTYEKLFGVAGRQNILLSVLDLNSQNYLGITGEIEKAFSSQDIKIAENGNINLLRNALIEHLKVILGFLSIVSLLAVLVGGLSIASAIGINISERKREIGILRAIGSSRVNIIFMILAEVTMLDLAGWLLGLMLSYPVSVFTGNYFGQIFLHSDLNNAISTDGALLWFALSISVSIISGFIPAIKAAKSQLKETLSYE